MKNILPIIIAVLVSITLGFILGRYSTDSNRYFFKYAGENSSLFDTRTGDLYVREYGKITKGNYKDMYEEQQNKKNNSKK